MPNLNKIKIPTTNNNKVLTTDENGIIKDTSIDISGVEKDLETKHYILDVEGIANETQIDQSSYPELFEKLSEITDNFFNKTNQTITIIGDNNGQSPTMELVESPASINDIPGTQLQLKWDMKSIYSESLDGIGQYIPASNLIRINYEQATHKATSASIAYSTNSMAITFLAPYSYTDGEQVTYLPEHDSQPANKKYVDQQIASIQSQINTLETTVDEILGQQEETQN